MKRTLIHTEESYGIATFFQESSHVRSKQFEAFGTVSGLKTVKVGVHEGTGSSD